MTIYLNLAPKFRWAGRDMTNKGVLASPRRLAIVGGRR